MAAQDDVTAPGGGGLVERPGGRGAPVDEQRLLLVVGDADPPDVAARVVLEVEAAEDQPVLHLLEAGERVLVVGGEGVALRAVLRGARRPLATHLLQPLAVAAPEVVEPRVDVVDELLVRLPRNSRRVRLYHEPSPSDRLTIIYDLGRPPGRVRHDARVCVRLPDRREDDR